jgi:hypothetical protein
MQRTWSFSSNNLGHQFGGLLLSRSDALAIGPQYKLSKIKFPTSMMVVTPATASNKACVASW